MDFCETIIVDKAWQAITSAYAAVGSELSKDGELRYRGRLVGRVANARFEGDSLHHDFCPVQPIEHIDVSITI